MNGGLCTGSEDVPGDVSTSLTSPAVDTAELLFEEDCDLCEKSERSRLESFLRRGINRSGGHVKFWLRVGENGLFTTPPLCSAWAGLCRLSTMDARVRERNQESKRTRSSKISQKLNGVR